MIKVLFDEDIDGGIVNGIRRRRPDFDAIRAVDSGLAGRTDFEVLEFASTTGRVVISCDRRTMRGTAIDRIGAGISMPGLILVPRSVSRRDVISELLVLIEDSEPEDWINSIAFLPYL